MYAIKIYKAIMSAGIYLDSLTLTNILLAGLCFDSVIIRFLYYLIPFLHITMKSMHTIPDQHNIFIFLLLRQTWVKLESDIEEP